jgi:hypothetical protein
VIPAPGTDRNKLVGTTAGLLVGGLAFFLTLFDYTFSLTRTAVATGFFSQFYDLQGRRLLDGHLDVPDGSLGIEGFIHGGKTFMYFPLWPAILRLPVLMTTHEYDARLSLISMALAWIVFAVMVVKLIWLLVPVLSGLEEVSRTTAAVVAVFLAVATGGTFLTFDAGQPWVYHEAYLWAVASVVGGIYWLTRLLARPSRHAVWWLFVFGLISVGSRATEGWALCLVVVAVALFMRFRPDKAARQDLWWRVLLAGAVPLLISIAINEYKFGSVYLFPLQDQVWTQVNQHRRDALAANGGTITGPQFFTTSFMAYLRPDGIRFTDYFPFVSLPAHAAPAYNGAFVDQTYRTGSATAFMPLLFVMFLVAFVAVFRPRTRAQLARLRMPMLVSILVTGGVMGYGYYANRYSSEFVPAFVLGGAVTTALLCGFLARRPGWRPLVLAVMAIGTVFSILAQMSVGTTAEAFVHRGDLLERYVQWQHDVSPGAQSGLVSQVSSLPTGGQTDDLAILGDCQTLYINTGDRYEPWLPVQDRDRLLVLTAFNGKLRPGRADLIHVTGTHREGVRVEVDRDHQVRFVTWNGSARARGAWFDLPTDGEVRLGIRDLIALGYFQLTSTPGGPVGFLPSVYFDEQWNSVPALLTVTADPVELAHLGFRLEQKPGLPMSLCQELAKSAGIDVSGG